jgi:hypothetical protein
MTIQLACASGLEEMLLHNLKWSRSLIHGNITIILILGWCILLHLFITKNDSTTLVRNLSCLYCKTDYTTCFGYFGYLAETCSVVESFFVQHNHCLWCGRMPSWFHNSVWRHCNYITLCEGTAIAHFKVVWMTDSWQYDHHIYWEGNATPNSRKVTRDCITIVTGVQVKPLLISNVSTACDVALMPVPNSEEWFYKA